MKRLFSAAIACTLAGALLAGCSKSSDQSTDASASPTGPITDSASTGLKPVAAVAAPPGDAVHGKAIFEQNCSSCHGAAGQGGVGPSLKGEKSRKNYDAAIVWIKDPKPPMPKLYPAPLGEKDVEDVAAFVETL